MSRQLFEISAATSVGKVRENNEDNFFVNDFYLSPFEANSGAHYRKIEQAPFLAGVSDGMGGENQGEEAAFIVASSFARFRQDFPVPMKNTDIKEFIKRTNREICIEKPDAGATIAMVYADDKQVKAVSVGDSRIYLYSKGKLRQISKDHTLAQMYIDSGLLTPEQAKKSNLHKGLMQYLGTPSDKTPITPDFYAMDMLLPEDILLLCSDGLTDMLEDSEIEKVLKKKISVSEMVEELEKMALSNGGRDNVTVMIIKALEVKTDLQNPIV